MLGVDRIEAQKFLMTKLQVLNNEIKYYVVVRNVGLKTFTCKERLNNELQII